MGNFWFGTFVPWLSFEGQDDSFASDNPQLQGFGLTPFSYGATSGSGSEGIGLSNWSPQAHRRCYGRNRDLGGSSETNLIRTLLG
jgi:hypothetical protein